ncbi:MAG: class I poly(R)-hydroxyalkanoic acid synthase [Burkholderiaceae bacterium]
MDWADGADWNPLAQLTIAPEQLLKIQSDYLERLGSLWSEFLTHPTAAGESIKDSRFADPAWSANPLAAFTARAYLLNSEFMTRLAASVEADVKLKKRLNFAVAQWVDAASPSNYLALNPKAQQTLIETRGESLKAGLANLLADLNKGKISQTDEAAFEVGRNVATSRGEVVFENGLIQLIQYAPATARVRKRPFLIVPPCINKFYILDLQPDNSLVRYAVEQGNTVFLVSWKNPHEAESRLTWDDYVERGVIEAIRTVQAISGQKTLNTLGFCVGGTLLATALAVLAARGEQAAASFTLMTSLLDFSDTGVLDVFIDEASVQRREQTLGQGGLMAGADLANTFSSLRAKDLVWNYVVSNYLEGRQPAAFDLLYWNGDSTNLPGPMFAWYLRKLYLENQLKQPGALTVCGETIDLTRIQAPVYVFGAREDHIVPWRAALASARVFGREHEVRFVLGASGHIAGSINPPTKNRRSYWTGPAAPLPAEAQAWLAAAVEHPGSWWKDWNAWMACYADGEVAAPQRMGNAKFKPIEPAPGRYVKEKA